MKNRIAVLLLAMTMVLATLVGCGSTEETGNQNDNTSASGNVETNVSDEKETESNNASANIEVESNVSDATEQEFEKEDITPVVIDFDEMIDNMVAEYGEVEFIPVFPERNFEDTIAYLETQLRPTEHQAAAQENGVLVNQSGKFAYYHTSLDGENFNVTIPAGTGTWGEAVESNTLTWDWDYVRYDVDWYGEYTVARLAYNSEKMPSFSSWSRLIGDNIYHFEYNGEPYVFLYYIIPENEYAPDDPSAQLHNCAGGMVFKSTSYMSDKTLVRFSY